MADKKPEDMTLGELRKAVVTQELAAKPEALKMSKEDLVALLQPKGEAAAEGEDETDWDAEPAAEGETTEEGGDGDEEVSDEEGGDGAEGEEST